MEYTEDQLTEWVIRDDSDQLPVIEGVYNIEDAWGANLFSGFFAGEFHLEAATPEQAFENARLGKRISVYRTKWRGLFSDPSAPKNRSGNKRKTMYVVMGQHIMDFKSKPDSSFSSKKHAEERAKYLKKIADEHFEVWIEKIRFLTPEA